MRRVLLVGLVITVSGVLVFAWLDPTREPVRHVSEEGRFAIRFPTSDPITTKPEAGEFGVTGTTATATCQAGYEKFVAEVTFVRYPPAVKLNAGGGQFLDFIIKMMIGKLGATIESRTEGVYGPNQFPCRDLVVETKSGGYGRLKFFFTTDTVYCIAVTGRTKSVTTDPAVTRLFDSFEFLPDPPPQPPE